MKSELSPREVAFVSGVLEIAMGLFPNPVTQKQLADAMGTDASDMSRRLKKMTSKDLSLIRDTLLDMSRKRRISDPDGLPRYVDIEAMLADGLDSAGRAVEQALAPAYRARINSRSPEEARLREVIGQEWKRTVESTYGGEPSRERILQIGRLAWPDMPDTQSAFVFYEIGRLLCDEAKDGQSLLKAVEFCERSESRHARALIKAVLERLRCYGRLFRTVGVPEQTKDRAYAVAEDMFRMIRVLCGLYTLPPQQFAEIQKAMGEFERAYASKPGVEVPIFCDRARPYFQEAADNYAIAWTRVGTMDEDERADPNHRKASICHNWGYCHLFAGSAAAREHLEDAIRYYLRANRVPWVAYNFKYLAIWYEAFDEPFLAVWCIRAAKNIYVVDGERVNSNHVLNLVEHEERIAQSSVANTMKKPAQAKPDEASLDYAQRLLEEYEGLVVDFRPKALKK